MPPITWKNIEAPNFNGSLLALDSAGRSFNNAGNNLNNLFNRIQNVNNNQLDLQKTATNQDIISLINGSKTLQDFNTQEQSFDPSILRQKFGQNFDADVIQQAKNARLGVLQNEALAGATTEALKLASETGSVPNAANTLRQRLMELGVKDAPTLDTAVMNFMQKSGTPIQKSMEDAEKAATAQAMMEPFVQGNQPQGTQYNTGNHFDDAVNTTLDFEGELNPKDTNGTPSKWGFNQANNKDINVLDLNRDTAKARYKTNYWDAIEGDKLAQQNPQLAKAAFDTAVLAGPGKAKELMAQAGGDTNKFLDLRNNFLNRLAQSDPAKYGKYQKGWGTRTESFRPTNPEDAQKIIYAAKSRSDLATEGLNRKASEFNLNKAITEKADKEYVDSVTNKIVVHRRNTGELNSVPSDVDQNDPRYLLAKANADKTTSVETLTNDPESQTNLANTSAIVENNLANLQQVLSTKEAQLGKKVEAQSYLMPSDDFMKEVKDKGVANVFRNRADQPGVIRDWFTPYAYADDVTEGITKIQDDLLKVYKDPEKVAQILAVSLKMAGAEGSGADGKRKNLDMGAIKEKLNEAKVFVETYVPLKNQYITLQSKNKDTIRDAQLAAKIALNTNKSTAAKNKISNKHYTPDEAIKIFEEKMKEYINSTNAVQETPTYLSPETKTYIDNEVRPDKGLLNLLFGGN